MAKVNWTFQALEDLDEIAGYQAQFSEKFAGFLVDEILENVEQLALFPFLGRKVPEVNIPSIREMIIRKYRVIYSVPDSSQVFILTIRSTSLPFSSSIFEKGD
ncbi:MAG: type II toxin-antitoxin system RelE/ParE family toxin [Haliscomenobacter sp.]|nr:type II toxin-antitoxin system RelE/ParE family toxin [Haliscomenobacter sp.]MBK8655611.1 type II toxin-antitoxin system RelE/ParE family toxin [Haliscomenobacter sp.]